MNLLSEGPIVSVIIITFNRCELVTKAIDSVLEQDYKEFELIVVDDGSTDGTGDFLKSKYRDRIKYVWQENQGQSAARNFGVAISKGTYIAFLDSDDLWLPEKLSLQVPVLKDNPEVGVVFCQAWQVDCNGQIIYQQPLGINTKSSDFTVENLLLYNKIPAGSSTCLIRRSVLEQAGGFAEDIHYGDEWDLWLRIASNTQMIFVSKTLASYRRHRQTQSYSTNAHDIDSSLNDRLLLLERYVNQHAEKIPTPISNKAFAYQYVWASFANYFMGDFKLGKNRLSKALELCPAFWRCRDDFARQVTAYAESNSFDEEGNHSPEASLSFVDLLCQHLPESLDKLSWIRLTRGKVRVEIGFREYRKGNPGDGRRYILEGIWLAPKLLSLAVLAVLAEHILGRKTVNKLRNLRHRENRGF